MLKPLTEWITTNCGKFLKRWKYKTTLPASWETCMQLKKQELEPNMEQLTSSKWARSTKLYCRVKVKVHVSQLCLTLCDPMNYKVLGILQARILEWVAFPFSKDLCNPGTEPRSPALQADSLSAESHRSPRTLKWVDYPFSSGLPNPGIELGSPIL